MSPSRCVRVIERRMRFLDSELDGHLMSPKQESFVLAELSALTWALPILCAAANVEQVYVAGGPRHSSGEMVER